MIRLGLRLTLNGGKEAAVRLAITAAAVALGVGLLLVALAGMNAINAQNARTAWLNTGSSAGNGRAPQGSALNTGTSKEAPGATTLWWLFSTDYYTNKTIDRVDLAATGPGSPVPPGMNHLPGPGQYYVSPALARLLHGVPANQLADRFPGREIGVLGPSALPSPDSLIIVIGHSAQQLSQTPGAEQVTSINTNASRAGTAGGFDTARLQTIVAVGALALLLPVLIFIATAARLSAARREQRFAAMRLVGATPRQVSVISTIEATVAALVGVAFGFGVFFAITPALTHIAFTGQPFAPGDLALIPVDILVVALGVPLAAAASARIAMRRVQISPLGVTRRVTPPAPRAYRLIPLAAGLAELGYFVAAGHPQGTGGQIWAYLGGTTLVMAGLVIAGPWVTMAGPRLLARRATRPASLLAIRRIADNPTGAFRTVSGLVIALFITSVSVGVIGTMLAKGDTSGVGAAAGGTLIEQFSTFPGPQIPFENSRGGPPPAVPADLVDRLDAIDGVQGVTTIYSEGAATSATTGGLALCKQLAATPVMGACPSGASVVRLSGPLLFNPYNVTRNTSAAGHVWPAASINPEQLRQQSLEAVVVQTNGSTAAVEQARTMLETAFPNQPQAPATFSEINAHSKTTITQIQQMTNVVIVVSMVIAGCSLAVSATAGISDRKRPFSLLRLSGVPIQVLRRVVLLETAVPLMLVSVLSAGTGFLTAGLFLDSQLGLSLRAPSAYYYLLVLAGLAISLAVIAATLPLVERITGPEVARNE